LERLPDGTDADHRRDDPSGDTGPVHLYRHQRHRLERRDVHGGALLTARRDPDDRRPEVRRRRGHRRRREVGPALRPGGAFAATTTNPAAPLRVTIWGENRHEQRDERVRTLYPEGMHAAIRDGIAANLGENVTTRIALLDEPEHGLTEEVLAETDVLTWWGHMAHDEVSDEVAERVQKHVLSGMGLVVLHSGHWSKPFTRLMGTSCTLRWRNEADRELVWTVNPSHPIAEGVPHPIIIDEQEMYGEHFDIPVPDELVFVSSF